MKPNIEYRIYKPREMKPNTVYLWLETDGFIINLHGNSLEVCTFLVLGQFVLKTMEFKFWPKDFAKLGITVFLENGTA